MSTFLAYHMQYSRVKRGVYNRRSDILNFIGSDQKVTPSCCFLRDDAKNTNLSVFIQSPYARTILRNSNMEQSLFKKHLKFQNFDEIVYCGITALRETNLDVFIQFQYTRTILRRKKLGQSLFKKHLKFQIFR